MPPKVGVHLSTPTTSKFHDPRSVAIVRELLDSAPSIELKHVLSSLPVDGSEIPNNHLRCIKPCKQWGELPINWCRISAINNISYILTYVSKPNLGCLALLLVRRHSFTLRNHVGREAGLVQKYITWMRCLMSW